jgi:hypothetical protein
MMKDVNIMENIKVACVYVDEHSIVVKNNSVIHSWSLFHPLIYVMCVCLILLRFLNLNQSPTNEPHIA